MSKSLSLAELLKAAQPFEADPKSAVIALLQRGDLLATAVTYRVDHRGTLGRVSESRNGLDNRVSVPVPTVFWIAPEGVCQIDWNASDAVSTWSEVDSETLAILTYKARAAGLFVNSASAAAIWSDRGLGVIRPVSAGGRTAKYDWEGAILELARLDARVGTENKSQAELVRHLQEWFAATRDDGDVPAESDLKKRVSRFQRAMTPEI